MRSLGSRISTAAYEVVSGQTQRRGQVPLEVAEAGLASRATVKRRTFESDRGIWRNYIAPRWRFRPVVSNRVVAKLKRFV